MTSGPLGRRASGRVISSTSELAGLSVLSTIWFGSHVSYSRESIVNSIALFHLLASVKHTLYILLAGYKITYSVATLNYDNYYVNLRDYNNSLLSDLL